MSGQRANPYLPALRHSPDHGGTRAILTLFLLLAAVTFSGCGGNKKGNDSNGTQEGGGETEANADSIAIRPVDVTEASGINAVYSNGQESKWYSMLETLGGGVTVIDHDLDGFSDLFFPGGGRFTDDNQITGAASSFWHNRANLAFRDLSDQVGIDTASFYSHGGFVGDYNRDGFSDLLITGYGGVRLYHNMGDGTFELQSDSGLPDDRWSSCAAWGDFNGDGELDVFVVNYLKWSVELHRVCEGPGGIPGEVCSPKYFDAESDILYLNQGDGTFVDASSQSGIVEGGKGLGVMAADFDLDNDLDLYVANDTTPNFLYVNDGNGNFEEQGLLLGVALDESSRANGSMGVALGDYNLDGLPDLGVANFEHESYALYRQQSGFVFFPASDPTGITDLGENFVSWGTCFIDLEADGDEDLIVSNGHILYFPENGSMPQVGLVMQNNNGRFARLSYSENDYFGKSHYGRGVAWGDLNRDGRYELVFSNVNEPAALLTFDESTTEGFGKHLFVRLIGTTSNRDGTGAVVRMKTDQGEQLRPVISSSSFLSSHESGVVFGIPKEQTAQSIEVTWPSGKTQAVNVGEGHHLVIVESE